MPAVPFIPLISQGVGAAVGAVASKKAQAGAMQRSPEEVQALQGAQGIAGQSGQLGTNFLSQGTQNLDAPANYFRTLLQGNRAAMNQATAGTTATITDQYRGAAGQLQGSMRGAQLQNALAALGRDRANALARVTTGVQPGAAASLAGVAGTQLNAGGNFLSNAGNIYGNLLGQGYANRIQANTVGENAGTKWGQFIADIGGNLSKALGGDDQSGGGGGGFSGRPASIVAGAPGTGYPGAAPQPNLGIYRPNFSDVYGPAF